MTATGSCTNASSYSLAWGDGFTDTSTGPVFTGNHTYFTPGTYTATLTGFNVDGGVVGTASATITVTNAPPSCTLAVAPTKGQVPLTVTATVTCTDPENDISGIVIDWGDGTSTQLCGDGCPRPPITAQHTYNSPGTFFVTVTATDAFGAQGSSPTVTVTVLGPPPTVTAVKPPNGTQGTNLTVQVSGTNFVATEGGQTRFAFGTGITVVSETIDTGSLATVNISIAGNAPTGPHNVTATNPDGQSGTCSGCFTVIAAVNQPPSCTLKVAPASGTANSTVFTATASCTDAENDINKITINWRDGTSDSTAVTAGTANPTFTKTHTYAKAGTFTVTATATDTANNTSAPASQQVVVTSPVNQPPSCTLKVAPASGTANSTVFTATASCTDAENDINKITINWGDGTSDSTAVTAGTANPTFTKTHTYAKAGTFTVTATATDTANNTSAPASQQVVVTSPVNQPPSCTLKVTPASGTANSTVFTATASCTDAENDINKITISWGDGNSDSTAITPGTTNPTFTKTHAYASPGTFTVTATATDTANNTSAPASQQVFVAGTRNQPPTCTLSVSPSSGNVSLTISAAATCTDPENDISSTVLNWGDGAAMNGTNGSHTYMTTGIFTVSVIATDSGGLMGGASQNVTVNQPGVLYVGVSNGQIKGLDPAGVVSKTLNTNLGGTITGMAFDHNGVLYATDFTAANVTKFDAAGKLLGNFGSGYNCEPESIVFDNNGNAYVGEAGCTHAILKFDPFGNLAAVFNVAVDKQGSDWIDLAADQCTLFYTSEGTTIQRFNVCNNQQLPVFSSSLKRGLALRLLPGGGALVADKTDIVRVDSFGNVQTTYQAPGESCWVGLTLDPDGTSFWAADFCSSDIVKFDIASGSQLVKKSAVNAPNTVYSVATRTPLPQSTTAGTFIASPESMAVAAGSSAQFSLNFIPTPEAANQTLPLLCSGLPVGARCLFSPPAFQVGSNVLTSQLTITTSSLGKMAVLGMPTPLEPQLPLNWAWTPVGFGLLSLGVGWWRKKGTLRTTLLLTVFLIGLVACVGSNRKSSNSAVTTATPAGTYLVRVQAGSGALQSSTVVKLVVQ